METHKFLTLKFPFFEERLHLPGGYRVATKRHVIFHHLVHSEIYVLYISLLFYFVYIMYIIYFIYIKYIFHLYGFQVLVLKLLLIENTSFICTNRVNLLCSRSNSDKPVIVAKGFLNLLSLLKLKR